MFFDPRFSVAENEILQWIQIGSAMVSILGSCFVVMSFVVFPNLRSFLYRMIVYLCMAEFVGSVGYLIGLEPSVCQAQAVLLQYCSLASLCWTVCIAHNIFKVLASESKQPPSELAVHLFSWGTPIVFVAIDLSNDAFAPLTPWCWIRPSLGGLRLATYFLPLMFVFFANLVMYFLVIRALQEDPKLIPVQKRLWHYMLAFVFCHLVHFIFRVSEQVNLVEGPSFSLTLLHTMITPLQGLINAIIYGLNVQVRTHYSMLLASTPEDPEGRVELP